VAAVLAGSAAVTAAETITATIPPHVLVLSSAGGSVSVHTDVPFSAVDPSSVALDGIFPTLVKSDLRGQLAAKFNVSDIKAMVAPHSATLTLTGMFKDGTPFAGTDTIQVKK